MHASCTFLYILWWRIGGPDYNCLPQLSTFICDLLWLPTHPAFVIYYLSADMHCQVQGHLGGFVQTLRKVITIGIIIDI